MRWIRKRLRKYLESVMYETESGMDACVKSIDSDHRPNGEPILRFRVYAAQNGKVLEFDRYDPHKDRSESTVYIIGKDEDLADKVSKCVTLESMK